MKIFPGSPQNHRLATSMRRIEVYFHKQLPELYNAEPKAYLFNFKVSTKEFQRLCQSALQSSRLILRQHFPLKEPQTDSALKSIHLLERKYLLGISSPSPFKQPTIFQTYSSFHHQPLVVVTIFVGVGVLPSKVTLRLTLPKTCLLSRRLMGTVRTGTVLVPGGVVGAHVVVGGVESGAHVEVEVGGGGLTFVTVSVSVTVLVTVEVV